MSNNSKLLKFFRVTMFVLCTFMLIALVSICAYATTPTQAELDQNANDTSNTQSNCDADSRNNSKANDTDAKNAQNTLDTQASDNQIISKTQSELQQNENMTVYPKANYSYKTNTQDNINASCSNSEELTNIVNKDYPTSYDLRNIKGKNFVTSVKNQAPFSSCWAFATMAASEISILSMTDTTSDEEDLNLSEHQLAWFAKNHIPTDSQSSQAGEGGYYLGDQNESMNNYALSGAATAFGAGIGPITESKSPYRGLAGIVTAKIQKTYQDFVSYEAAIQAGADPQWYSSNDDWSLDESLRFDKEYTIKESSALPSFRNGDGTLSELAVASVKNKLTQGNGVAVAYCADSTSSTSSTPETLNTARYINVNNWAQYTWCTEQSKINPNHAVCIVGWDDDYDKNNFTINNPAKWDTNTYALYKSKTGTDNLITEDGKPYYKNANDDKVLIEESDRPTLVTMINGEWNWIDHGELENDSYGRPYFPDGTKSRIMPDIGYTCDVLREDSGSKIPPENGAWIVKNSWGGNSSSFPNHSEWGNDGYFYISYYDYSLVSASTFEFSSTDNNQAPNNEQIFMYDYMPSKGFTGVNFPKSNAQYFKSANVYVTDKDTYITDVSTNTIFSGTKTNIDIYILNDSSTSAFEGRLIVNKNLTIDYSGYHRIKLDEELLIPAGTKFSIVCTQDATINGEEYFILPFSFGTNLKYSQNHGNKDYYKSVINPGESYITYADTEGETETSDCADFWTSETGKYFIQAVTGSTQTDEYDIDNFPIRAYGYTASNPVNPTPEAVTEAASTGDATPFTGLAIIVVFSGSALTVMRARKSIEK